MPKKRIPVTICPNCEHALSTTDHFCAHCGQENHRYNQSFKHLLLEVVETELHFDTKVWVTLKAMFLHPGLIVRDFIADRRARYVPPVRMYVFTSFIMFLLLSLLGGHQKGENGKKHSIKAPVIIDLTGGDGKTRKTNPDSTTMLNVGFISLNFSNSISTAPASVRDSVQGHDTNSIPTKGKKGDVAMANLTKAPAPDTKISEATWRRLAMLPKEEAEPELVAAGYNNYFERRVSLGGARLLYNNAVREEFVHETSHLFSEILFVLMPIMALYLYLLNIRRRRNYYEYLIFSVYYHSVVFILLSLSSILSLLTHYEFTALALLGAFVYLLFSVRTVYEASWLKATLKAILLFVIYLFTVSIAYAGIAVYELVFF